MRKVKISTFLLSVPIWEPKVFTSVPLLKMCVFLWDPGSSTFAPDLGAGSRHFRAWGVKNKFFVFTEKRPVENHFRSSFHSGICCSETDYCSHTLISRSTLGLSSKSNLIINVINNYSYLPEKDRSKIISGLVFTQAIVAHKLSNKTHTLISRSTLGLRSQSDFNINVVHKFLVLPENDR